MVDITYIGCVSFGVRNRLNNGTLALSKDFLATPLPNNLNQLRLSVVHSLNDGKHYHYIGHIAPIDYICFGNYEQVVLTACKHTLLQWEVNVEICQEKQTPRIIAENLGFINHVAFSSNDTNIAICAENKIWIIEIKSREYCLLSDSEWNYMAADFSSQENNYLISVSECKTYEIWSIVEHQKIYQSSILSVSPCTSLAIYPLEQMFAIGFADGVIHIYDMTQSNSIHLLNLWNLDIDTVIGNGDNIENAVLSLKYFGYENQISRDSISDMLEGRLYLAVGCTKSLVLLNAFSFDVLFMKNFSDINLNVGLSSASQVSFKFTDDQLYIGVQEVFSNDVHLLKATNINEDIFSSELQLSVLSQEPLEGNSPLRSSLAVKKPSCDTKVKKSSKVKVDKMDQPIVMRKKIISSGYTKDKPRSKMFAPKINDSKAVKNTETNKVGPWGLKKEPRCPSKEYPTDVNPPTHLSREKQLSESNTPINDLIFSDSGKSILVALSEKVALMIKTNNIDSSNAFAGHNGPVNTVKMGHTNQILITSSIDRTVKLWIPGQKETVVTLDSYRHNFKSEKVKCTNDKDNPLFKKDINSAMFYYNDQFILLSHGESICLYKYNIDNQKDDIKRYQSNNRYKLVKDLKIEDTQNITTFSSINSFYSYLVLCACSNRDIVIFDLNKGERAHTIRDAHTKPIHSISQYQGSSFVSHPSQTYDLYLTAACTDAVKLWDMRTSRCVRRYENHMNRSHRVGLAFSTCSRYITVGSENRSAYVYDIRSSSYLRQLKGFNDVVSSVTYHPQIPLLACGTLSGQLKIFDVK